MKIRISQNGSESCFKASNSEGASQITDGSAKKGLRPMESLLNALATCAALDVIHILNKQKQAVQGICVQSSR